MTKVLFNSQQIDDAVITYIKKNELGEAHEFYTQNKSKRVFPLIEFCKVLGIKLFKLHSQYNNSYAGVLAKNEDGSYAIHINTIDSETRQRFTIAHELGHIFLQHELNPNGDCENGIDKSIEFLSWGAEYLLRDNGWSRKEQEANNFASALLIREENIKKDSVIIREDLPNNIPFLEALQSKYNVSYSMLTFRCMNLGIKVL